MNRDRNTDAEAHALAALKTRAMLKLWLVTVLLTEVLSTIFSYAADWLDAGSSPLPTLVFTCVTSVMISRWLVADAQRAWSRACEHGYVRRRGEGHALTEIAPACPQRWLVVLHAGLNPRAPIKK